MRYVFASIVFVSVAQANAQWMVKVPLPEMRSAGAGAVVGSNFYFFGGATVGDFNNLTSWRFNIPTNQWIAIAPFPTTNVGNGGANSIAAAAIGSDIYCVGGYTGSGGLSRLIKYNTVTNSWTVTSDPLSVNIFANAAVALGGKFYALGGNQGTGVVSRNCFVYDPAGPSGSRWTAIPMLNIARRYPCAMTDGTRIFVMGGLSGAGVELSSAESWQPGDASWTLMPNMSRGRGGAGAFSKFGRPYIVGGGFNAAIATGELFDGAAWSANLSLSSPSRTFAFGGNTRFMVKAGGWNGGYSNATELFDTATAVASMNLVKGTYVSGNVVGNLLYSDNSAVEIRPGATLSTAERPIQLVVDGSSISGTPIGIRLGIEASATASGINLWTEAYNWVNGNWVQVDQRTLVTTDSAFEVALPSPFGRFVSNSGALRLRLSSKASGPVLAFPWRVKLDEVTWRVDWGT